MHRLHKGSGFSLTKGRDAAHPGGGNMMPSCRGGRWRPSAKALSAAQHSGQGGAGVHRLGPFGYLPNGPLISGGHLALASPYSGIIGGAGVCVLATQAWEVQAWEVQVCMQLRSGAAQRRRQQQEKAWAASGPRLKRGPEALAFNDH